MEPLQEKRTRGILSPDFENGASASEWNFSAREDLDGQRGLSAFLEIGDLGDPGSIFVSSREKREEIAHGCDAPRREDSTESRADPFDELDWGVQAA